jgi:hypothetical protein
MRRGAHALAAYVVITLAMTWPLARGLARDVAWDLGDPVLNMWILAWDFAQMRAVLSGDLSHLATFFDANIFHPAPLTLAYSEHLLPQALQAFPLYALTGNVILCYNLLFLSTFALSGLGMYLLVRELTGNTLAAFVGGLLFAFAPYRIPQSSHLQVLSSQWMPFAFYGIRRYFATGRRRALAGATAAVIAEALSCGYYLLYFSPFVAGYVLWELWRERRWRDRRAVIDLTAAAGVVVCVVAPFVLPYLIANESLQLSRSLAEATRLSADVYSYLTASELERFWGRHLAQVFPKPEGELFPGLITVCLALVGLLWGASPGNAGAAAEASDPGQTARWRAWLIAASSALAVIYAVATVVAVVFRRVTIDLWLFEARLGNVTQLLLRAAAASVLLLALSPATRRRARAFFRSQGWFAAAFVTAAWLSLGPAPRVLGRPLDLASPYRLLWDYLPGFEGLRVPARFAMIATLMLAVLGGYGAAAIARRPRGRIAVMILAVAFLLEAGATPFVVNGATPVRGFNTPEARLYTGRHTPAVYAAVANTPSTAVLAELPLGQTDFDLRAMFYSTTHWRRLVNGYSGFFPPHYRRAAVAIGELPRHARVSFETLRDLGTTHVIVHERAFLDTEGPATTGALRGLGARELFRDGGDVLLALPVP